MSHHILVGLAGIILLGMAAQWIAWRFRFPSILILLLFGFLAGPVSGRLHPDALMGDLLLPIVSLSVAVILFEGGLSLRLRELRQIGHGLFGLVTVGILVAWVLGSAAALLLLRLDMPLALLLGAVLVVTGPTVVLPLMRHVQPRGYVGSLVKWEGILNDPVGAMLAVLVFEVVLAGGWSEGKSEVLSGLVGTLGAGVIIGLAGAAVMVALMRYRLIPDYLESPFTLMMVVVAYTASDFVQEESGLLTVTLMGIAVANQRFVRVDHIIEFKENLRVILISFLFILLAARLDTQTLAMLDWRHVVYLVVLIVLVRPATVYLSTFLSKGLTWRDRLFLCWMAPRGIVAAAMASLFALRLGEAGYVQADILVPQIFLIIVGTVTFYGLTAAPVARWLGLAGGPNEGTLIVGAHAWGRRIAAALQAAGIPVALIDTNRSNLVAARLAGLTAHYGNALAESLPDVIPMDGMGRLLALTANSEVNALAALHFEEYFGRDGVFQLSAGEPEKGRGETEGISRMLRGRTLFAREATFPRLSGRFATGAEVKSTNLTDEFSLEDFRRLYGESARVMFVVRDGALKVSTVEDRVTPRADDLIIALVDGGEAEVASAPSPEPGRRDADDL